jgi:hypothetical protein
VIAGLGARVSRLVGVGYFATGAGSVGSSVYSGFI